MREPGKVHPPTNAPPAPGRPQPPPAAPAGGGTPTDRFAFIRGLLHRRTGVVVDETKDYLLDSRLGTLARERREPLEDYLARLPGDLAAQEASIQALLNHETSFFRDWHPFEALREHVLPELVATRRARGERRLRVWCAACSSGQEPYSFAILLREHFAEVVDWDLQILATDVAEDVLELARGGVYRVNEINRGIPAPLLARYFEQDQTRWSVSPIVRRMVEFRRLNLIEPLPSLPPMDLIFLRNVLIYFDVPTKLAVLRAVRRALAPGGLLVLGSAETTLLLDPSWVPVRSGRTTFYAAEGGA